MKKFIIKFKIISTKSFINSLKFLKNKRGCRSLVKLRTKRAGLKLLKCRAYAMKKPCREKSCGLVPARVQIPPPASTLLCKSAFKKQLK